LSATNQCKVDFRARIIIKIVKAEISLIIKVPASVVPLDRHNSLLITVIIVKIRPFAGIPKAAGD